MFSTAPRMFIKYVKCTELIIKNKKIDISYIIFMYGNAPNQQTLQ